MDQLSSLRRRERIIAMVRWVAVLFALGQVVLHEPQNPAFAANVQRVRPWALALVALLALAGVAAELLIRLVRDPQRFRWLGAGLLAIDCLVALGIVLFYRFEPGSGLWAVLVVLPIEGAVRFQLRGALAAGAALMPAYLVGDLLLHGGMRAGIAAFRLGLIAVVAVFSGVVTRDLEHQRRLLAHLHAASREIATRLDAAAILEALCREVVRCLEAQSAGVYVHDGEWFHPVAAWPVDELPRLLAQDEGEQPDPALVETLLSGPRWLQADEARPDRLAVPIRWRDRRTSKLLVVRPGPGGTFDAFQTDAAASLAELAAVGLATTQVLAAEQRSNRRLRYLEALRTRFVATVAHDLRMPLTVFKGVSRLLRNRGEDIPVEQVHEMLATVERQANRLSRLADDLLDAARMDADKLSLKPELCDLRSVIAATIADAEEDFDVETRGDVTLVADAARLERILWNLVSNAEKYGKPPFEVRAWGNGAEVSVSVRDHGAGLDERKQSRLFEEFSGSDDATSVGIGLAIVHRLVGAHGGQVRYEDAEPGACFVVTLPVAGPPTAEPDDEQPAKTA